MPILNSLKWNVTQLIRRGSNFFSLQHFNALALDLMACLPSRQRMVLCISTSKRVLCMPFTGRNQFFDAKTTFWVLLSLKMYKIMQKMACGATQIHNRREAIKALNPRRQQSFAVLSSILCVYTKGENSELTKISIEINRWSHQGSTPFSICHLSPDKYHLSPAKCHLPPAPPPPPMP